MGDKRQSLRNGGGGGSSNLSFMTEAQFKTNGHLELIPLKITGAAAAQRSKQTQPNRDLQGNNNNHRRNKSVLEIREATAFPKKKDMAT